MASGQTNRRIEKKTYIIYEYEYIVERINAFHANKMCANRIKKIGINKKWQK